MSLPKVFKELRGYQRPLELWPMEYICLEDLAGAVSQLAKLDSRAGEGTLDYPLSLISNQLFDLLQLLDERYQEQDKERGTRNPFRTTSADRRKEKSDENHV